MKEVTSTFDDFEKRLAIFVGLGALLLHSLACLLTGADMDTYLVRGLLVFTVFALVGWWYGGKIRRLFGLWKDEELTPRESDNTTVTTHDAPQLPEFEAPSSAGAQASPASEGKAEDESKTPSFVLPGFDDKAAGETAAPGA